MSAAARRVAAGSESGGGDVCAANATLGSGRPDGSRPQHVVGAAADSSSLVVRGRAGDDLQARVQRNSQ